MGTTAEKLQKLISTKAAIKTALENKGLTPTDKFDTYPALIDSISGGGGGDVDIDFIASEDISAGDKVYLKVVPASTFDSKTYVKVAANTYYACNSSETGQYYYYYDGTTLTKNTSEFKGAKFLAPDIDNCFMVTSTGISYRANIETTVVVIHSTSSGYTLGDVFIYPITKTKYIIFFHEYKSKTSGLYYAVNSVARLVTLADDYTVVQDNTVIKSDVSDNIKQSHGGINFIKDTDKIFYMTMPYQGSSDNIAYHYYKVTFADDFSSQTATTVTSVPSTTNHYIRPVSSYQRYQLDCEGNCFYSSRLFYYKDSSISKKSTTGVTDTHNVIAQYSNGKIYVKKFKASIQTLRPVQTNGYNNYTFLGTNYGYDVVFYNIIVSHVVKSGGIFVGYAKTSATAGNNVTVSMVADYILDTEDVQ